MGRMVRRAAGCGAGFVDRHRRFDLTASDFDTRSGWPSAIQTVGGLFQLETAFRSTEDAKNHLWPRLPGFAGHIYLYKCQAFTRKWLI